MNKEVGLEGKELRVWAELQFRKFKEDLREEATLKHAQELELLRENKNFVNWKEIKITIARSHDAPRHRFPNFNEKTDDLNSLFQSFECQAQLLNNSRQELKVYLLASLLGGAREVFDNIPVHTDYESIKKYYLIYLILLLNFLGENYFQLFLPMKICYIHRLSMYFERWVALSETTKDYNNLRGLILKHVFLSS